MTIAEVIDTIMDLTSDEVKAIGEMERELRIEALSVQLFRGTDAFDSFEVRAPLRVEPVADELFRRLGTFCAEHGLRHGYGVDGNLVGYIISSCAIGA